MDVLEEYFRALLITAAQRQLSPTENALWGLHTQFKKLEAENAKLKAVLGDMMWLEDMAGEFDGPDSENPFEIAKELLK